MSKNKKNILLCFFGVVMGLIFFILVYGVEIINPFNYKWNIVNGGDSAVTFWGGIFFQKNSWLHSIKGIDDLTYPYPCSLIFYDAVIPLAYVIKLIYKIFLNNHTIIQYIGIHNLLCCGLQGLFSALIVLRLSNHKLLRVIGIVMLTDTSILMYRLISHNSLGAQYIILAAITIYLYKDKIGNKRYLYYTVLTSYSAVMHLYFTLMLSLLIFIDFLEDSIYRKKFKQSVLAYLTIFFSSAIILWIFGGFQSEVASAPYGTDAVRFQYHSNLLTLIDPDNQSLFLRDIPQGALQYEGFGYLGFGVIILLILEIIVLIKNRSVKKCAGRIKCFKNSTVIIALITSYIIAVGPHIMFGNHFVFDIPIPSVFNFFFFTFKSLGRFIWITVYILICASIYLAQLMIDSKMISTRVMNCVLLVLCLIQVVDLSPVYTERHAKFAHYESWESSMKSDIWDRLAKEKKYICLITDGLVQSEVDLCNDMKIYAYHNDMKMTATAIAHPSTLMHESSLKYFEEIKEGNADPEAIYWFETEELMDEANKFMHTEIIDGYYIGWLIEN